MGGGIIEKYWESESMRFIDENLVLKSKIEDLWVLSKYPHGIPHWIQFPNATLAVKKAKELGTDWKPVKMGRGFYVKYEN